MKINIDNSYCNQSWVYDDGILIKLYIFSLYYIFSLCWFFLFFCFVLKVMLYRMYVNSYMFCCWQTFIIHVSVYCLSVFRQTNGTTAINRCHWTRGGCQGDTFPGLWPIIFNHGGTTFCRWRAPCKSACVNRLCESVRCTQKLQHFNKYL